MKVACQGDSITNTAPSRADMPYPTKLEFLMGASHSVGNHGVLSALISGASTMFTNSITGKGFTHDVLLIGVNDILAGTSGATAYTAWAVLANAIRSAGLTLIPCTVMPFGNYTGWSAGKQTELAALNASIASYAATNSLTLVDLYAGMGDTDPTKLKASYDCGDGLHPNQAGANQMATLVATALGF